MNELPADLETLSRDDLIAIILARAFDSSHLHEWCNRLGYRNIADTEKSGVYEGMKTAGIVVDRCYVVTWSVFGGGSTPQVFQTARSEPLSHLMRNIAA